MLNHTTMCQRVYTKNPYLRRFAIGLMATIVIVIGGMSDSFAADDFVGAWTVFNATDAFQTDDGPSRWSYWIDAQARYFDVGSGINQYLVRPGIGFKPGENLSVWAGYARFRSRNRAGFVVDENRYWQQLNWTSGQWNGGTFSMRARLLERFVDAGDDMGLVLRFLTRYVRSIGTDGKKSLILGIEPFVDLRTTDWSGGTGIYQNRTYIGVGWRVSDKLSIDTGYMNQFLWVDNGDEVSNHLAILNFKTKF